jgi:hypothetical protein
MYNVRKLIYTIKNKPVYLYFRFAFNSLLINFTSIMWGRWPQNMQVSRGVVCEHFTVGGGYHLLIFLKFFYCQYFKISMLVKIFNKI